MMLEILQYATSGFFTFIGCVLVTCTPIMCIGWAFNAMMLGFKGIRAENPLD